MFYPHLWSAFCNSCNIYLIGLQHDGDIKHDKRVVEWRGRHTTNEVIEWR